MRSEEYIEQEIAVGERIHLHQGVWWRRTSVGGCRPALPCQLIRPGEARPARRRALFGYSHLAPIDAGTPERAAYWVFREADLEGFCFEGLEHAKRKAVSKARRSGLRVERLEDVEPWWEDLRGIAASMAERTGYGRSPEYYSVHFAEWREVVRREFRKPNREWWGVFAGDRLAAYMYAYLIDDTMYLESTKTHSAYLLDRASDYLYFSVLEYCRDLTGCREVNTGRGDQASGVDRFKESLGFTRVPVGEYFKYNAVALLGLRGLLRLERTVAFAAGVEGAGPRGGVLRRGYSRALEHARRVEGQGCEGGV